MQSDSTFSVVIAGGGFCGVMTLINLIDQSKNKINITLVNKGYPLARGIAYKTYSDLHLLNVETRNMSAFHDCPDHFLLWCLNHKNIDFQKEELPFTYLPRNLYGKYLEEIFEEKTKNIPENITLQIINDEVTDIEKNNSRLIVKTLSGKNIAADKFLLATGNCEPGPPMLNDKAFLKSKNYFSNPWTEKAVIEIEEDQTVLIIGAGLTMVDVIIGLREKNFTGKIIALSPHGYKILPHRKLAPQPYILNELVPPYKLENLFRLFYKHIREARRRGLSGETVVDAIRLRTQEIWQHLSLDDKKKFMMHLRHLWGVARHRLPVDLHQQIQQLIKEEKLEIIAGRIREITETENGFEIKIRKRKDQSEKILKVKRIINCTGPETDIRKQKSPLFESLLKKRMIRPDAMNLGIETTSDGNVIDEKNIVSNQIFAIGSLLKGKLWESTAIPELRFQAHQMAKNILKNTDKKIANFEMYSSEQQ